MEHERFRDLVSQFGELSRGQKHQASEQLQTENQAAESLAAIELSVDEARTCARCNSPGAVARGKNRGLRRYGCKACGRNFNATTNTPLQGLHHKERWLTYGESLSNDEIYLLHSYKGQAEARRKSGRAPRRRGGQASKRGLSGELVPMLFATDRGGATRCHTLRRSNAESMVQLLKTKVSSDALLVSDANPCYGVVSSYLDSYMRWYHLLSRQGGRNSPEICLRAALSRL